MAAEPAPTGEHVLVAEGAPCPLGCGHPVTRCDCVESGPDGHLICLGCGQDADDGTCDCGVDPRDDQGEPPCDVCDQRHRLHSPCIDPPSEAEAHYLRLLTRGEPTTEDRIAARMLAALAGTNARSEGS